MMFDANGELGSFAQSHATIKTLNGSWFDVTVRDDNGLSTPTYRACGRRHVAAILLHCMMYRTDVSESRRACMLA